MLTPQEELKVLDELPQRFERDDIKAMIAALQDDIARETVPLPQEKRVHRYAFKHRTLLIAMPFLFRAICRGTFRDDMVDLALKMRDLMDNGMSKEDAFQLFVTSVVDNVNASK